MAIKSNTFCNSKCDATHQLKFSLSSWGHTNRLDALLARRLVIESEEGLVRLNTFALVTFRYLERKLKSVSWAKSQRLWFFGQG